MLATIELKPEDANGTGGTILQQMGARRAVDNGNVWLVKIPFDVAMPNDFVHIYPFLDALADAGVKPMKFDFHREAQVLTPRSISGSLNVTRGMGPPIDFTYQHMSKEERYSAARALLGQLRREALGEGSDLDKDKARHVLAICAAVEAHIDEIS